MEADTPPQPAADDEPSPPSADAGEPHCPAPTLDDLLRSHTDSRQQLSEGLAQLSRQFEARLAIDRHKDQLIDRLHEELQGYRSDLLAKAMRPIIRSLCTLHDDAGKMLASLRDRDPAAVTMERVLASLASFQGDVTSVLEEHGVAVYRDSDAVFNPRRQRALKAVPTGDVLLANRVAERMRAGFEQGGVILEKERVAVYAYDASLAVPAAAAAPFEAPTDDEQEPASCPFPEPVGDTSIS